MTVTFCCEVIASLACLGLMSRPKMTRFPVQEPSYFVVLVLLVLWFYSNIFVMYSERKYILFILKI